MKKSIKAMVLGVIASVTIVSGVITSPANAVSPLTVTVSKTTELSRSGETVKVTVTGLPIGGGPFRAGAAVYVFQCATTKLSPRPSSSINCVSERAAIALANGGLIGNSGIKDGAVPQDLNLVTNFVSGGKNYDCTKVACSIFIRAGDSAFSSVSDASYDQLIPITFEEAPKLTLSDKVVSKIKFATGEKSLSKATKKKLKADLPSYVLASKIVITGTAGSTLGASESVVKKLAKKRATAIKKFLVSQGVASGKIVIKVKVAKAGTKPSTKIVANP